ncbi:MAG TPA: PAS domain S-box protein [Candidatus Obscuribacterales bacterium]
MSLEQENDELRQRITELEDQLQSLKLALGPQPQTALKTLATSQTKRSQTTTVESGLFRLGSINLGLTESEELFRAYLETVNDMVYVVDLAGRLTFVNPYGQKLLGCDEAEWLGQLYLEFVAPQDRARTAQAFSNLLETGELTDFEFALQSKAGSSTCMAVNGRLLYRNQQLVGGIGIARDISDRKQFEKQLQMFLKAVESAYDSAVITNIQGEIIYANPATARIFDTNWSQVNSQNAQVFYPEEDQNQVQWLIQKAIAGGWSGEVVCQRCNGDRFPALVSVGLITSESGQPEAVSIISRDITDQKQAQAELAAKNIELERASHLKSEFLANMSHELRTPLTSILGFSSLLEQQLYGPLGHKQLVYIEQIQQSGEHLLNLINEVLDLAKVEAGQIVLNVAPIAVEELCATTLALVGAQARSREIRIYQRLQPPLALFIADELRVRQMLLNLLSNAIKFSHVGGEIGLEAKTQAGYLYLTVWDQGIGIPAQKQNLLFQPFQQLDSSLARQYEGTGLGLSLTRQLAELHGGTVEFEPQEGQGSRFTIRLPLHPYPQLTTAPSEAQAVTMASASLAPSPAIRRILVVEDHPTNAMLVQDILQHWGYDVSHVADGLEALSWLVSYPIDLVLLDIHLPGLDGFEVTRRLRAHPDLKHIPVIATTAMAMVGDRDRCLAAGMQGYISKPIDYEELAALLTQYTKEGC